MKSKQIAIISDYLKKVFVKDVAIVFLLTLIGTGIAAGMAGLQFGSIKNAIARFHGKVLLPDVSLITFDDVPAHRSTKIEYKVRNLAGRPVRIQGSQTSCSCTVLEGIPRTMAPWDKAIIVVQVTTGPPGQRMFGGMDLITDESNQPLLHLDYAMQVAAVSKLEKQ